VSAAAAAEPAARAGAAPGPALAPGARPEPDREQARRVAQAFLEALASGDAAGLARASAERFSFDGEAQSGRDGIQRTWRALLAGRSGPAPRVNAVEVLAAPEAVARYGKPPPRVAALVRTGVWVAVGDVGGRPVVLFLAREGGRLAVLGIHD
jgi:hypothetical protein